MLALTFHLGKRGSSIRIYSSMDAHSNLNSTLPTTIKIRGLANDMHLPGKAYQTMFDQFQRNS